MTLQHELIQKQRELTQILETASQFLKDAPEGRVRIARRGKGFHYYHITQKSDTKGTYIKKEHQELVTMLVKKDYYQKIRKEAEKELRSIKRTIYFCKSNTLYKIYENIGKYALDDFGIPYKYECPVEFPGIGPVFIDFTLLIPRSRQIKYLEHFGMMDGEDYLPGFFWKYSTYIRNGLIPDVNFIMTIESDKHPLNTRELNILLENLLKCN